MSWKYFFDRDTSFREYLDIPLSERKKNVNNSKPVVEVTYGKRPLEAVGQLFKLNFYDIFKLCKTSDTFMRILAFIFQNVSRKSLICTITFKPWYHTFDKSTCVYGHVAVVVIGNIEMDIWEAKDAIASILNNGEIPDVLGTAKYSLMFDYEHVEVDSVESCFAEIHQRNDSSNSIPLFVHRSSDLPFIAPKEELLPAYYESGELSEYSWVLNSGSQEKESYLMINGAKYYFGIAEIEKEGLRNKISLEKLKNAVQYHFQDRDELCTSISCTCSPEKKRIWLCMYCLWLIREFGGTGVVCRCRRNKIKKMKVYCNGCKINEIEIKRDPINNKEIDIHEQQKILDDIAKNRDGNQDHNGKEGNRTPGQSTQGKQKSTFDNSSGSGSAIDLLKRNNDPTELSLTAAGEQLHAGAVNTRRRSHDVHNQRSPSKPKTFVLEGLAPKKQPAENRGLLTEDNRQAIIDAAAPSIASSSTGREKDTQSIDGNNDHKAKGKEDTEKEKNVTENRGDINPAASNIAPLPTGAERDTKCINNIENGPTEKSADGGKKKEDKKKEEEDKKKKEKDKIPENENEKNEKEDVNKKEDKGEKKGEKDGNNKSVEKGEENKEGKKDTTPKHEESVRNDKMYQLLHQHFNQDAEATISCFLNTAIKALHLTEKNKSSRFAKKLEDNLIKGDEIQNDINISKQKLPKTICTSKNCIKEIINSDGKKIFELPQDNLSNCFVFNRDGNCVMCGCSCSFHMHINDKVKTAKNKKITRPTKAEASQWVANYFSKLEEAKTSVYTALELAYCYLYQKGIAISNDTFEAKTNLEIELQESSKHKDPEVIQNLRQAIAEHKMKFMELQRILCDENPKRIVTDKQYIEAINNIFELPLFGSQIRDIYGSEHELYTQRQRDNENK
ncbi:hypothetical protein FO519_009574, partial [Halicephalobus sp. NKZ332]